MSTDRRCGICGADESSKWYKGKVFEEEKTCKACGNWENRQIKEKEKKMKKMKGVDLKEFETNWMLEHKEERETRMEKQKKKQADAVSKLEKWRTTFTGIFQSKGGKKNDESANNNPTETERFGPSEAIVYGGEGKEIPFPALVGIQEQWVRKTEEERKAEVKRLTPLRVDGKVTTVKNFGTATVCIDFFLRELTLRGYLTIDERNPINDAMFRQAFGDLYYNRTIILYLEKFMEKVTSDEGLFAQTYTRDEVFSMFGVDDQDAAKKELNDKRTSIAKMVARSREKQNEEACAAGEDCVHEGGVSGKGERLTHPNTGEIWHAACVRIQCSKCGFQGFANQHWYDADRVRQRSVQVYFLGKNLLCSGCISITCGCLECSKNGGINAVQKAPTATWFNKYFQHVRSFHSNDAPFYYAGHVLITCTCEACSANNGANALVKPATALFLDANDFSVACNFDQSKNKLVYAGHVLITCTCEACSANNGANALVKPATAKFLDANDFSVACNFDQSKKSLVYAGHVLITCTCEACSANNGANALVKPATAKFLDANDFSVACNFDQSKKSLVYAGHVLITCTCEACSANNGANALVKPATATFLDANDFSEACNFDQSKKCVGLRWSR